MDLSGLVAGSYTYGNENFRSPEEWRIFCFLGEALASQEKLLTVNVV
jgi:hypothetical protein